MKLLNIFKKKKEEKQELILGGSFREKLSPIQIEILKEKLEDEFEQLNIICGFSCTCEDVTLSAIGKNNNLSHNEVSKILQILRNHGINKIFKFKIFKYE